MRNNKFLAKLLGIFALTFTGIFIACTGDGDWTPSGSRPIESATFLSAVGNHTLTITLTGGTFAAQANLPRSYFNITRAEIGGFTNLEGGTVKRTSETEVTITGLAPVTETGSGQKITVDVEAFNTQASEMEVVASGRSSTVSTLAGSGEAEHADALGLTAKFNGPAGITIDDNGNLYVADTNNHRIRKIDTTGVVTTLAGSKQGHADASGLTAKFDVPYGITIDGNGNLYVADSNNHLIRQIDTTEAVTRVTTFAKSADGYGDDSKDSTAKFKNPAGITIDGDGNFYVADTGNDLIRKITATGVMTTFAGSTTGYANGLGEAAKFNGPVGITTDGENLYVTDSNNNLIRKIVIATGAVTTLAGKGTFGYADGTGTEAQFHNPTGITTDGKGNLYVADTYNQRIRKIVIATGAVTTLVGSTASGAANGLGTAAQFFLPTGITTDGAGNLYVADKGNHSIRKIVIAE